MSFPKIANILTRGAIVGTVHSGRSLAVARKATLADCDLLELRLDCLSPRPRFGPAIEFPLPCLITARHPAEGGANALDARARHELYLEWIGRAALADLELRSARALQPVIGEAKRTGVHVILSYHNFQRTPPKSKLKELSRKARDAGADVFKVATLANSARDLAILIDFLSAEKSAMPLAVMGMGQFGKISRLVLAQAGSCLNYGYLGSPNASGQWPARLLKARLRELEPEKKSAG